MLNFLEHLIINLTYKGRNVLKKFICIVGLLFSGISNASLIGDSIACEQISSLGSFSCDLATNTVTDPGIEFYAGGGEFISFDFDASSLTIEMLVGGSLGGTVMRFTSLDFQPAAALFSVDLVDQFGINNLDINDVSFTQDSVTIDFIGTDFAAGDTATLIFNTAQEVSAPAPITLFGLALAGFAGVRRLKA